MTRACYAIIVGGLVGQREIDRAAMEIVRLASPYAPLPDNIRERVDVLHITRTWREIRGATRSGFGCRRHASLRARNFG